MTHDLLVIGGGAGGMAAARTAARLKKRVVLVQDGEVGGDCTFTGCVPSKTLIESAAQGLGFEQATSRVRDTVARIAATETADVLRSEGIDVVEGRARLTGPRSAAVDGLTLRADKVVLATGAAPVVPGIPGLRDGPHLTNETVWDLTRRPDSVVVMGGGAIGCELAQALARFGVRVTVVEGLDRLLTKEEPDASKVVAEVFARDGIDVRLGTKVTGVAHPRPDCVRVSLDDGTAVDAEQLLVTVGRRPVTDGLDVEAAGVRLDDRGFIPVDDRLATNVPGVYAVGDVTGRLQFTHAADEMGRTAALNALRRGLRLRFDAASTPWVTFTRPEVARVGMTEDEAADHGGRVAHLPMTAVDRAVAAGATDGFITLIAGPRALTRNLGGGRLLGATIVGERAGEMIHEVALAMRTKAFAGRLAQAVHAYPTWSTGIRTAAAQFFFELDGREARPARRASDR
ncbi:MAG TPA: FAD-dependent oxidoreductase [Actinomycetes bacterium]|nr:FAD-dependent oxidoreductase [Actinomycetes bacterium]